MNYYERSAITHLDGTRVFQTREDQASERTVAQAIQEAWRCELGSFGALSPIDWYAMRHGRVVGVLELKSRSHAMGRYPTVFLNVRKWLALQLAATGLGVPAIFVVKFQDEVRWTPVNAIDANKITIGGCATRVKSANDVEPVIEVPITLLRPLEPCA